MNAGFPPIAFPPTGQLGNPFQTFQIPPPGAGITVPPPAAGGIIPMIPPTAAVPPISTAPVLVPKPSPGKGLNALLGLPTPSEEPAPPGTVVLPDGSHVQKKKQEDKKDEKAIGSDDENREEEKEIDFEDMKIVDEYVADNDVSIQDIPMPDADTDAAAKAVNEQIQEAFNEELARTATVGEAVITEESKRPYKFAWNEDIQEVDLDDSLGSDVSSVHTSDLSHFEESSESGDDDLETLQNKLLQLQKKQEMGKWFNFHFTAEVWCAFICFYSVSLLKPISELKLTCF